MFFLSNGKIEQTLTKQTNGTYRTVTFPIHIDKLDYVAVNVGLEAGLSLFLPREQSFDGKTYKYKFDGVSGGVYTGSAMFMHIVIGE